METTQEQAKAIDFLVKSIINKKDVVGFIAPGGCGKTFSLKHLAVDPRLNDIDVTFTATTNKAASVMKMEGIGKAMTLHSAISSHIPTEAFAEAIICYEVYNESKHKRPFGDKLIDFLKDIGVKEKDFYSYRNEKELIAENDVDSFDDRVFSHYAIGEYKGGAVFIDEASMLPTASQYNRDRKLKAIGLDSAQKVFDTVILVGDDSQLPPINGKSSFQDIEKAVLTKNLRAEDGLLRVLDYARKGGNLAHFTPIEGEKVKVLPSLSNEYFKMEDLIKNKVTHIVYRNATRKQITKRIRGDLTSQPIEGEPIVYKGANIDEENDSISKNETGVFNGVIGVWENHKQSVDGRNFDEYGDGFTYLQYGYAITAHTSQGSSFDYVIVHLGDIPHFIDKETKRKWIYTAISRARKGVVIVY